jgi:hypothetical protein
MNRILLAAFAARAAALDNGLGLTPLLGFNCEWLRTGPLRARPRRV